MAVNLGSAYGKIEIDTSGIDAATQSAASSMNSLTGSMQGAGRRLTAGVTAPLVGMAAAGVSAANNLNSSMANVQTLLTDTADGGTARVGELTEAVQTLSVETGKSTEDLAGGLYQVISAFGDTSDSVDVLRIAAQSATAGLSTTEESINLLSAVTKGYGDTSAEAVQKASDLAFQTVKLGQTTFPELASSMGKVVPLAATLGVSQEELAAQFATLTGVTGNASEVSTQLRATYQGLLKPTGEMASSIAIVAGELERSGQLIDNQFTAAWRDAQDELQRVSTAFADSRQAMDEMAAAGQTSSAAYKELVAQNKELETAQKDANDAVTEAAAALGQSIVQSVGYTDAMALIADTADGNTDQLGKMFGSVEALNAVLALSGSQAETYEQKLASMNETTGATNAAFAAQTEGVNAAGFAQEQLAAQIKTIAQDFGQALLPAMTAVLAAAVPLVENISTLATWFANLNPQTQTMIVGFMALAAAVGPLLLAIGPIVTAFSALATIVGVIVSPIGLVAAAVAGLAAVLFDWGGANDKVATSLENMGLESAAEFVRGLHEGMSALVETTKAFFAGDMTFSEFFEASIPDWISTLFGWAWPVLAPVRWVTKLMTWAWPTISKPDWFDNLFNFKWPDFPSLPGWWPGQNKEEGLADGTAHWRGGRTWVGERGPELIDLPTGTRVYDAETSASMAAGGGVNVTINAQVAEQIDLHAMAMQVAKIIQRRQRY